MYCSSCFFDCRNTVAFAVLSVFVLSKEEGETTRLYELCDDALRALAASDHPVRPLTDSLGKLAATNKSRGGRMSVSDECERVSTKSQSKNVQLLSDYNQASVSPGAPAQLSNEFQKKNESEKASAALSP
jgi:hypothetical protein